MKLPTKTLLTLILGLSSVASYGTTFDYSYTFAGNIFTSIAGDVVSGSFEGDVNGNFVENISNVSVFVDGVAMTGTFFSAGFYPDGPQEPWGGPAIVSFDAAQNNFGFFNSPGTFYSGFYMIHGQNWSEVAKSFLGTITRYDTPVATANWSLTARTSGTQSVPDGGNMAMMLGGGLVCLVAAGRRKPTPLNESKEEASLS